MKPFENKATNVLYLNFT